jgi:C-terminal processing protease CtpA/Prc
MKTLRIALMSASLMAVVLFTVALAAGRGETEGLFKALGNLAEVVHLIQNEYVDELNEEALVMSLDAGIVESVDRQAAVLPADMTEAYGELVKSPPAFGLLIGSRLGSAAVRKVIVGSPAAGTDLQSWEVIERVDGVNTRGRPLWQLRLELAGKEAAGDSVTLTVVDRLVDERREVELQPSPWTPTVASVEDLDDAVLIEIDSLPEGAAETIAELVPAGRALVVDLRELAWGVEAEAVAVADLFATSGQLAGWEGRKAGSQAYAATEGGIDSEPPVVLVGPETEGVGEILAAALRRSGSSLVGGRTVGHASHMRFIESGDLTLWLPVGKWLRADGTAINGNGVEPDEEVASPDEDSDADPVLDRALEMLRQPLEQAA